MTTTTSNTKERTDNSTADGMVNKTVKKKQVGSIIWQASIVTRAQQIELLLLQLYLVYLVDNNAICQGAILASPLVYLVVDAIHTLQAPIQQQDNFAADLVYQVDSTTW